MRVGVVFPAYDEVAHIPTAIASLPDWVAVIIVVDDGSTDGTAEYLATLDDPRLCAITHSRNLGFGAAMTTGYRAALDAGCDVVVKMDADGQMDPDDLPRVVEPFEWGLADFVKGNRFYTWRQLFAMPPQRRIGNLVASLIAKAPTGYWHSFDPHCGYTAISAAALRQMDPDALSRDYRFQVEQLFVLRALGLRLVDVPVEAIYGDEVSGLHFGDGARFPYELLRGWLLRVRVARGTPRGTTAEAVLESHSAQAARVGESGWWRSPVVVMAGLGALLLAVVLLLAGLVVWTADRTVASSHTPGSQETREAARRRVPQNL